MRTELRHALRGISSVAVLLTTLSVSGCLQSSPSPPATSGPAPATSPQRTTSARPGGTAPVDSGLPGCAVADLPKEAGRTVTAIRSGGPFAAAKDGATFGNREGRLPRRPGGFYREYTVPTPGENDRGARRVVTGGNPATAPQWFFYTGDHYQTFCQITGA